MKITRDDSNVFRGGCLQGHVTTSYARLLALFGEPNGGTDEYKVSTEYALEFEGKCFSLYDYKETSLYSRDYPSVAEFRALPEYGWHIGGENLSKDWIDKMSTALMEQEVPIALPVATPPAHAPGQE